MGDVDRSGFGVDPGDHGFEGSDKEVFFPEIRQQGDEPRCHGLFDPHPKLSPRQGQLHELVPPGEALTMPMRGEWRLTFRPASFYNRSRRMGANGFDGDSEAEAACRDSIHLVKRWAQVSAETLPVAA